MATIYLIRHGETDGNTRRIVQVPETPLSERGLAQAERLAARLGDGVAAVLSSDLARARMTAERVAETAGAPLALEPALQERNFGDVRGTAYADLGVDLFAPDYAPPGGETWAAFHARVDRAWQAIEAAARATEGPLAVVTHGLVCHSLVSRRLALAERLPRLEPEQPRAFGNTAVTVIEGPPVEGPPVWTVTLLACTAHLGGEGPEGDGRAGVSGL